MACSSTKEVAVFTDTNLGTHIAMAVSPDISAGDFKRELAQTHFSCFPKIGEIKVYGLMVKRRSSYYHLPDMVPIKYAFQNLKGTWFLHMEARPLVDLYTPGVSHFVDAKVGDHNFNVSNVTASLITCTKMNGVISNDKNKRMKSSHGTTPLSEELPRTIPLSKRKRKKRKRVDNCNDASVFTVNGDFQIFGSQNEVESTVGLNSSPLLEISRENLSKAISPSGFGRQCLSNFSEVSRLGSPLSNDVAAETIKNHLKKQKKAKTDDKSSSTQNDASPKCSVRTPLKTLSSPSATNSSLGSPRDKSVRTEVGKRLIRASKNLSRSACKKRPSILFRKFKNGKLLSHGASSVSKYLVFEISDKDE